MDVTYRTGKTGTCTTPPHTHTLKSVVLTDCVEDERDEGVSCSPAAATLRSSNHHLSWHIRQRVCLLHPQKQSDAQVLHLLLSDGDVRRRHSGTVRRPAAHLDRAAHVGSLQKSVELGLQDEQRRRLYGTLRRHFRK